MLARNTEVAWGWAARLLHWATAVAIGFQLTIVAYIWSLDDVVRRFEAAQVHKSWGVVILGLTLVRLGWRLANRQAPRLPATTPGWQVRLAGLSHAVLYSLLLLVPLAGWTYASASPLQTLMQIDNEVFGLFALPDPWPAGDERLADAAYAVHRAGGLSLAILVAAHAAAALKHHYVDKDDVLVRMTWPR